MSLMDEMVPYTDGNSLACPNPVPPYTLQGSDNGPSFESEKTVIAVRRKELSERDRMIYLAKMASCLTPDNLLCRVPYVQIQLGRCPNTQSPPDDHYALFNGMRHVKNTVIPRLMLKAAWRFKGFMNNVEPGKRTGQSFLYRQPPLVAALVSACFPSWKNPLHILARLAAFPFYLLAALEIARSCYGEPVGSTDPRRLSWHLIQTVKDHSLLCKLASRIWYSRLRHDYFEAYLATQNAMRGVAAIYYHGRIIEQLGGMIDREPHPFAKYWID